MRSKICALFILLPFFLPPTIYGENGASLFQKHCSECHGNEGRGGKAPALKKEGLLVTADIDYFANSIRFGRPIRGCPSFRGKVREDDIIRIASYIKGWQKGEMLEAPDHDVQAGDNKRGREIFAICGGCHGVEGEGAMGPPLMDPGLLKSASDTVLRRTIMYGRPGTPMKGYLSGMGGLAVLTVEEIDQLIAYIRYREKMIE